MSDENEPVGSEVTSTPDLTDVRQLDDGGATALIGLKYQYHFAAYKCLEMLSNPGQIEYVACELHDDVAIRLRNGTYEFYQVKEKRGELWKISTLKSEGVWERFWWLWGEFGDNNEFLFVSDQSAKSRVSNKPDLGKMKDLTDRGRDYCNDLELIDADGLIDKLMEAIGVDDKAQVEALFWNTRILTDFQRPAGLIAMNLNSLEQLLLNRGIESDISSRSRIYRCIVSVLEDSVADPLPGLTYRGRLEARKIDSSKLANCLTGPYKDLRIPAFRFGEEETQQRSLRKKSKDGKFPEPIIRYFLDSRNHFQYRYRQDVIHSADYLSELRLKVWDVCSFAKVSVSLNGFQSPLKTYETICKELRQLTVEERRSSPPVEINYPYLHGIMCQLTAECDNDWVPIE
jgi:hypothetical protein